MQEATKSGTALSTMIGHWFMMVNEALPGQIHESYQGSQRQLADCSVGHVTPWKTGIEPGATSKNNPLEYDVEGSGCGVPRRMDFQLHHKTRSSRVHQSFKMPRMGPCGRCPEESETKCGPEWLSQKFANNCRKTMTSRPNRSFLQTSLGQQSLGHTNESCLWLGSVKCQAAVQA